MSSMEEGGRTLFPYMSHDFILIQDLLYEVKEWERSTPEESRLMYRRAPPLTTVGSFKE
jgi:hypothetical protein